MNFSLLKTHVLEKINICQTIFNAILFLKREEKTQKIETEKKCTSCVRITWGIFFGKLKRSHE